MKPPKTELEDLIYSLNDQPWSEQNALSDKFESLLFGLKEIHPLKSFNYSLSYYRSFNSKTDYYKRHIENCKVRAFNLFYSFISEATSLDMKAYRLHQIIERKLPTLFLNIAEEIKTGNFAIELNPKKTNLATNPEHKSNAYSCQLVKHSLVHLFLELQENFKSDLSSYHDIEDIYVRLLKETVPDDNFISKVLQLEEVHVPEPKKKTRDITFNSYSYTGSEDNLKYFFSSLKDSLKIIHPSTNFPQFRKLFVNQIIDTPVRWTGTLQELYFLIKVLHKENRLIGDLKDNHWKLTAKCFVDKDGNAYDYAVFRGQKTPSSANEIRKSINLLL